MAGYIPDRTVKTLDELVAIAKSEGVTHFHLFDMSKEFEHEKQPQWHWDVYNEDPHIWHRLKVIPRVRRQPVFEQWYYEQRLSKGDSKFSAFFQAMQLPFDIWIDDISWTTYGRKKTVIQG